MKILFLNSLLFLVFNLQAQTSVWKATKNEEVTYFASTYGLMTKNDYPLPSDYYHVFNQVDALVFNYNSFAKTKKDTVKYIREESVELVSDEETKNKLKKIAKKMKVDFKTISESTPSNAINHLTSLRLYQLGYGYQRIKYYFHDKAIKADKKIDFLIDTAIYKEHRENTPQKFIDYYTAKAIDDFDGIKKWRSNYRKEWKEGITENIEEFLTKLKIEEAERYLYEYLFYTDESYKGLQKFLNNDQIEFVLISRLQLLGEDGIFKRLEKEGYQIEQL